MNLPKRFAGLPVSEGIALGTLHIADTETAVSATPEEVGEAFAAVAAERFALAERLRDAGREQEAAIIEVGGLIAADPLLADPAVGAFNKAVAEGASADEALSALTDAADAGAQATISMQALKGRASYLGPRSVGHEDPGAASTVLILHALRDVALRPTG